MITAHPNLGTISLGLLLHACSGGEPGPSSSGSAGDAGGSTGFDAALPGQQIPLGAAFEQAPAGPENGLVDLPVAESYCGSPDDVATQRPVGTVVRIPDTLRYFVCLGSLGDPSATRVQTNEPGDAVLGFTPYAALFQFEDAEHPNTERPVNGALNYALLVLNVLGSETNSECKSSNGVFDGIRIGGATTGLCPDIATPARNEGDDWFVDVTFPNGAEQTFSLQPVPFEQPSQ